MDGLTELCGSKTTFWLNLSRRMQDLLCFLARLDSGACKRPHGRLTDIKNFSPQELPKKLSKPECSEPSLSAFPSPLKPFLSLSLSSCPTDKYKAGNGAQCLNYVYMSL